MKVTAEMEIITALFHIRLGEQRTNIMATHKQCVQVGFMNAQTRTWTEKTPKGSCQPQSGYANANKPCCSGMQYFVQWPTI